MKPDLFWLIYGDKAPLESLPLADETKRLWQKKLAYTKYDLMKQRERTQINPLPFPPFQNIFYSIQLPSSFYNLLSISKYRRVLFFFSHQPLFYLWWYPNHPKSPKKTIAVTDPPYICNFFWSGKYHISFLCLFKSHSHRTP